MADRQRLDAIQLRPAVASLPPDHGRPAHRDPLAARISGEFLEMPGTCLTVPQASRLFGVPSDACQGMLLQLVRDGVLSVTPDGRYRNRSAA